MNQSNSFVTFIRRRRRELVFVLKVNSQKIFHIDLIGIVDNVFIVEQRRLFGVRSDAMAHRNENSIIGIMMF